MACSTKNQVHQWGTVVPLPTFYKTKDGDVAVAGLGSDVPAKPKFRSLMNGTLRDGKAITPTVLQPLPAVASTAGKEAPMKALTPVKKTTNAHAPVKKVQNKAMVEIKTISFDTVPETTTKLTYEHTFSSVAYHKHASRAILIIVNETNVQQWIALDGLTPNTDTTHPGAVAFFSKLQVHIKLNFKVFGKPGSKGSDKYLLEALGKIDIFKRFAQNIKVTLTFPDKNVRMGMDKEGRYFPKVNFANVRGLVDVLSEYQSLKSLEVVLKSDILGEKEIENAMPFHALPFTEWDLTFEVRLGDATEVRKAPAVWVEFLDERWERYCKLMARRTEEYKKRDVAKDDAQKKNVVEKKPGAKQALNGKAVVKLQ